VINPAVIDRAKTVHHWRSKGLIDPSARPKVTKFSVSSMVNIEMRLIPQATRTAAGQGKASLPRESSTVSRIIEVLIPAVTEKVVSI
jgi:hypothetical protein